MVTVREKDGDYMSLKAALDAGETSIDIDLPWTVNDKVTE